MMKSIESFQGLLDSTNYRRIQNYLKSKGISYHDRSNGIEIHYWNNGLYRISGSIIHLIFVLRFAVPFKCKYLSCKHCPADFRPIL